MYPTPTSSQLAKQSDQDQRPEGLHPSGYPIAASLPSVDRLLPGVSVLVIDEDAATFEAVKTALPSQIRPVAFAKSMKQATRLLTDDEAPIDLVLIDANMADSAAKLPAIVRQLQPEARVIVLASDVDADQAIASLRSGALDYLAKPLDGKKLRERLGHSAARRWLEVKNDRRLVRLKSAVRQLNGARRTVGQKVDLLCNDFVDSYAELAKQVENVRLRDHLRELLTGAVDLEQMLCHLMDWLLRNAGHCNIAIFLTDEEGDSELGAYMKYTVAGDEPVVDWMRRQIVPKVAGRPGDAGTGGGAFCRLTAEQVKRTIDAASPDEVALAGQHLMAIDCPYLAESLGTLVVFRDEKKPLTDEHAAMLKAAAPIFAEVVTQLVGELRDDDGSDLDEDDRDEADWWKRGDDVPF